MDIEQLTAEAARLILPRFDEAAAIRLGQILLDIGQDMPIVVNIRNAHRTFFHAALPGSQAGNDNWARRKGNLALFTGQASMVTSVKHAKSGGTLAQSGLSEVDYADHGGAVPISVAGVGLVAVATVSGLPQQADHALVIRGLEALKTELG